jgi:hypothetical protein
VICPLCKSNSVGGRRRTGPIGRKNIDIVILCDVCHICGTIIPVKNLEYKEQRWVDRYNAKIKREFEESL